MREEILGGGGVICFRCEMDKADQNGILRSGEYECLGLCMDCMRISDHLRGLNPTRKELEESYECNILPPPMSVITMDQWNNVPGYLKGTVYTGEKYMLANQYREKKLYVIYENESFIIQEKRLTNLNLIRSFRTSSKVPNITNMPRRAK